MFSKWLNFIFCADAKPDHDRKALGTIGNGVDAPPPLPPRPGRGSRLNPNKPYIQTDAKMKSLSWSRIILKDDSELTLLFTLFMNLFVSFTCIAKVVSIVLCALVVESLDDFVEILHLYNIIYFVNVSRVLVCNNRKGVIQTMVQLTLTYVLILW